MSTKAFMICVLMCYLLALASYGQEGDRIELQEFHNILYVDPAEVKNDSLQRLNLVIPEERRGMPLFIWIGGGAWAYVDRHMEMELVRRFAREGIAVASVGHRLSPAIWQDESLTEGIQHPEHIKDVATAVKWLYDRADTYGYDQQHIFVGGYSSGGHLAALLSMDETYLVDVGLNREDLKGVVPIAGAYDIFNYYQVFLESTRPHLAEQHVQAVFGYTEEDLVNASPTSYVSNMIVPMLLISENQSYSYTRLLEESIVAEGFEAFSVIHVHEMGHGAFWQHLSSNEESTYRDQIIAFIKSGEDVF